MFYNFCGSWSFFLTLGIWDYHSGVAENWGLPGCYVISSDKQWIDVSRETRQDRAINSVFALDRMTLGTEERLFIKTIYQTRRCSIPPILKTDSIQFKNSYHFITIHFNIILPRKYRASGIFPSVLLINQPNNHPKVFGLSSWNYIFWKKNHNLFRYSPGNFLYCCWLFMSASLATQCDETRTELLEGIGRVRQTSICLSHTIVNFTVDDSMLYIMLRHGALLLSLLVWEVSSCASVSWSCCRNC